MKKVGFLFGVLGVLAMIRCAPLAEAHAFPDHSEPRVGAKLQAPPEAVRIWFDGLLEPAFSTIEVHREDQQRVDKEDGRVDPSNPMLLEVSLPLLPAGRYRVVWAVVAVDGHRTEGDFSFTVVQSPGGAP